MPDVHISTQRAFLKRVLYAALPKCLQRCKGRREGWASVIPGPRRVFLGSSGFFPSAGTEGLSWTDGAPRRTGEGCSLSPALLVLPCSNPPACPWPPPPPAWFHE